MRGLSSDRGASASGWAAVDPALLGAVHLEAGCIADFDPEIDYFPYKTEFRRSLQLEDRYHSFSREILFTLAVDKKEVIRYALLQCGAPAPHDFPTARVIRIPIRRFTTGNSSIFSAVTSDNRTSSILGCYIFPGSGCRSRPQDSQS